MSNTLDQQIEYYRRRAAEYDRTAYGPDVVAATQRIDRVVTALRPTGSALEIACGTGMWTRRLARSVRSLVALDAAAETVAIAEQRVRSSAVTFTIGNVFHWVPDDEVQFDTIFMAFWLSHVPRPKRLSFLERVGGWLAPGGRVLIVDQCGPRSPTEHARIRADKGMTTELRPLESGATYWIVKEDLSPELLTRELDGAGWACEIGLDRSDWLVAVLSR